MKTQINLQEQYSNKKSKFEEPTIEDLILLLISIFTENGIKNDINGVNSLLLKFESKKFELTLNEIENIDE